MYTKNSDIGNHYSLYFHPVLFGDKLYYTKFSTHTPTTHVSERPPVKRSMSLTSSYTSASAVFISGVKSSRLLKLLATDKPQSPLYLIYDGMPESKFSCHTYLLCRTTVGRQLSCYECEQDYSKPNKLTTYYDFNSSEQSMRDWICSTGNRH